LWWVKGQVLPPLVTTQPFIGGAPAIGNSAVIGQPGTTVIFGGGPLDQTLWYGYRSRAGFWIDECYMLGLEGSFLFLPKHEGFTAECGPGQVVSRPFFDTSTGAQNAELVCFPGVLCGSVTINTDTQIYGADVNLRRNLCCNSNCNTGYRIDGLIGFRYMGLYETVDITEDLTAINRPPVPAGTLISVNDNFRVTNDFYGGQFGLAGEYRAGWFFADFRGQLALGATIQHTYINGTTSFTPPGGATQTFTGGLLAQPPAIQGTTQLPPSNIGAYQTTNFAVIPEVAVNIGVQPLPWLRLYTGYTFMYWSNVIRAGEQIPNSIDSRTLPPLPNLTAPGGPVTAGGTSLYQFHYNSLWMQGINFGTQIRF
jgi:hypothetical protein